MVKKTPTPIPAHLAGPAWYAPHQAWLRGRGLPHHDPGDAAPRRADLHGANLRRANLHGANLGGANLHRANLRVADLGEANLGGANLHGANLRRADLGEANLREANLGEANLREANLREANLGGANLGGAYGIPPREEAIALLDEIRAVVVDTPDRLDMSSWHEDDDRPHDCGTAHCLAGWAQALRQLDTAEDGIRAIRPASRMNNASDDDALTWLRSRAYAD